MNIFCVVACASKTDWPTTQRAAERYQKNSHTWDLAAYGKQCDGCIHVTRCTVLLVEKHVLFAPFVRCGMGCCAPGLPSRRAGEKLTETTSKKALNAGNAFFFSIKSFWCGYESSNLISFFGPLILGIYAATIIVEIVHIFAAVPFSSLAPDAVSPVHAFGEREKPWSLAFVRSVAYKIGDGRVWQWHGKQIVTLNYTWCSVCYTRRRIAASRIGERCGPGVAWLGEQQWANNNQNAHTQPRLEQQHQVQ